MTTGPAVQPMPRDRPLDKYDQQNEERYRTQVDDELQNKHDKRSHLRLGRGKFLVLSSPGGIDYAFGLDDAGIVSVTNYETGAVGTLVIDFAQVAGLAQEFIDVRSEFAAADGALAADISINASAITTNAGAISTLSSEITAARDGEASLLAKITSIDTAIVDGDTSVAATVTSLSATVSTISADLDTAEAAIVTNAAAISTEATARASADTAISNTVTTLSSKVGGDGSPIPDWDFQDANFWNLPGGTSFALGNPFLTNIRSVVMGDGTYDWNCDQFRVEPGATYEFTYQYWNGFPTMTGYVRSTVYISGVGYLSLVTGSILANITGAGGTQSGDIVTPVTSNTYTVRYTMPSTVDAIYIRTLATLGGSINYYWRVAIKKLPMYADFQSEVTTRASADTANSTAITTLRAATAVRGVMNKNPYFDDETSPSTGLPTGWTEWIGGAANSSQTANAVTPFVGNVTRVVVPNAGDNVGFRQYLATGATNLNGRSVAVRAAVRRINNSIAGAGVLVEFWSVGYSSLLASKTIKFATDPNTSGVISTGHYGRVTFEKIFTVPDGCSNIILYAMTNYSVLGTGTAKTLDWHECSISEVGGGVAGVTDIREALVTGSSSAARLMLRVNTATNAATIEAAAFEGDGTWNGSAISLTATEITLNGNVVITGTLTTNALEANAITNSQVSQTAAATSLTSGSYVTVASFSFTSVGIGVELRSSCDVLLGNFSPSAPSTNILWRIRRGTTVLKSGTFIGTYRTTDLGGGIFYNEVYGTIQADYNDIPSSGTYTYDLQIQITNTGGTPSSQASNRFLSGREFKR